MTPETSALISSALHWGVGALLAIAVVFFFIQFLRPGWRVGRELRDARQRLERLKATGPVLDLDRVRDEVMVSETLRHCWDEYRDTLHGQKQANSMGVMEVSRWRATSTANVFFTDQGLIEAPLRAEFYKHLPGVLTGLGIIGTFSGLIVGLHGFDVSGTAEQVRDSLKALIGSVGGAFMVSGIAIALAMAVTTIEKSLINGRYTELERLCSLIDSLFDTGAGEEYLQRLVEASETSATQAMQMKESLVTDLKQVLSELTQQQIATMTSTSQALGNSITTSLTEGLADPLTRISHAVQQVGNSQSEAVNKLLTDVLGNFTEQMHSMFGSQMRGMSEMLVQTANTIQTASQRFDQLAGQIQQAGTGAADAMANRMEDALQQMQARQTEANDQMRLFIDQLKDSVAKGQSESAELTMGMMRELSDSTSALVQGLRDQAYSAEQAHSQQQAATSERLNSFLDQMQASAARSQSESANATQRLLGQLGDSASGMVRELSESTSALVQGLRDQAHSAEQAHLQQQAATSERLNSVLDQMQASAARSQSESANATQRLLDQLGDSASGMVQTLQAQAQKAQEEHTNRQLELTAKSSELMEQQSMQIARLADAVQQASTSMQSAVERLQTRAQATIDSMGQGAEKLYGASARLGDNLERMKASSDGLNDMADKLSGSATTLSTALTVTQQVLGDQTVVRDALKSLVGDLRETVELAKREASMSSGLVDSLQAASIRLTEAQRTTETYLQGVTDVLGEAHGAFAQQMMATMREGNKAFHEELAHATGLLKGAIQDLGDVLDNLPSAA
ncbi:anti-phage ZorAB system protein ZorA [Curvibacter sp. HBC61]|uniref:Anti-phage ZorAB system protein ZorA n=1 Tax=Curvibacter cyanobacteriorum TaxID=3026422 RepID=A0ABT5MY78_9BURK|nr:anti-phage ZorAB system protein ZorA [Curvibacter sp. HBC61]MDD0838753.1 anti-phage ZorAB system protein ZorA [Curvibacter sp. HBC61]